MHPSLVVFYRGARIALIFGEVRLLRFLESNRKILTMPLIVTSTHYRRFIYSLQSLEHLARCRGVGEVIYIASCDPSPETPEIVDHINRLPCQTVVGVNESRLGCGPNTRRALEIGFETAKCHKTDYVIHVEDDVLLSPDALEMFAHCREQYRHDSEVFTVTVWNRNVSLHHERMAHELRRSQWFSPWAWATWLDRWQEINRNWIDEPWDVSLNMVARKSRFQIYPTLSRSQNIGAERGEYCYGREWHAENQHVATWACDRPEMTDPGNWQEAIA